MRVCEIVYTATIIKKGRVQMGKQYSYEQKEYVSKLIVEEGRVAKEVAYELEIPYKTLCRWVSTYKQKARGNHAKETYITPSELDKMKKQHEKQLKEIQEENEILKKAMHIFTKNQA